MGFENYKTKQAVTIVYTGEGKGKTSASIGLMARALGHGWRVLFVQFIKTWAVSEDKFMETILPVYKGKLAMIKGGRGFYNADHLSATNVSEEDHKKAAIKTYNQVLQALKSNEYDLIVCDEINNAVADGLLTTDKLEKLIQTAKDNTSLCLTGRNFPKEMLNNIDIATNMSKLRHHFDDQFLANQGIDY